MGLFKVFSWVPPPTDLERRWRSQSFPGERGCTAFLVKQKRNPITFLLKLEFLKEQGFQGAKQECLPRATAGARAGGSTPQQNIGALAMVEGKGAWGAEIPGVRAKSFQESKQSILCGSDSVSAVTPELSAVKNWCLSKCRSSSYLCLIENTVWIFVPNIDEVLTLTSQ